MLDVFPCFIKNGAPEGSVPVVHTRRLELVVTTRDDGNGVNDPLWNFSLLSQDFCYLFAP